MYELNTLTTVYTVFACTGGNAVQFSLCPCLFTIVTAEFILYTVCATYLRICANFGLMNAKKGEKKTVTNFMYLSQFDKVFLGSRRGIL